MKKDIILSGPPQSGKNWIANGIAGTYEKPPMKVLAKSFRRELATGVRIEELHKHSLIIIDECSPEEILELDFILHDIPIIKEDNKPIPVVYLTTENVTNHSLKQGHFHIIHCRNAHISELNTDN
jgi:hypothetical protein